jgi:hypothetical protein
VPDAELDKHRLIQAAYYSRPTRPPLQQTETSSGTSSSFPDCRLRQSAMICIVGNMKTFLSFLGGVGVMLGFSALSGSNSPHHVYELRMYHVDPGKMNALKARFGDHTDAIFKQHNMKSVGYWVPADAPNSQNLFIYLLEHPGREEAKKYWDAFHDNPDWQKVKADSEKNGPLVDHVDSYFMDPTSFSALQ